MYSGSTEFNNLIENPGGNALITRLTFADFTIEKFAKLEYYGGSNNSDDIAIGTTNMAYLDVNAITDKIITNQEFLFEVGMELSDGTIEYAPIGYFTVQKPSGDEDTTDFTAYDRMQKFEKSYFSALTYPTDSAKVLNELCTMCGVELATPIASPITIEDNLEGYTCREVLGYIAGIHGKFACIDRYGKLNLRWYSETPIEKQIGLIWSLTKSQDDYTVEKITLAKDSETTYTSGDGISGINHSNPYATQAIADSIYASLGGFTYRVCEISMLDDIRLDPWDMVQVTYFDGSVLKIPAMSLEHSFTNGETKIKSFGKTDMENEYSYSGPVTQAMDRMSTELLVANRIIATKVDAEWVNAHTVTVTELEATNARVYNLETNALTAETADLRYANITLGNIDTANIDVANIGLLFAKVGLIDRATIVDGHITGFLDAVEINANNITAGTLIADRILLKGSENGLLYALNNLGEVASTAVDTLDGGILTKRTITADKIVAESITANELDVTNVFGNTAVLSTLVSQEAFIDAISTNIVVVGAYKKTQEIIDNIYTSGTTTINGGKITTGSITADKIDVNNLFAQNITATGSITGAKLYGTYIETGAGIIGGFTIADTQIYSNNGTNGDGGTYDLHIGSYNYDTSNHNALIIRTRDNTSASWVTKLRLRYNGSAYFGGNDSYVIISDGRMVIAQTTLDGTETNMPRITFRGAYGVDDSACNLVYNGNNSLKWNGTFTALNGLVSGGDITSAGNISATNQLKAKSIELSASTSYIDFHYDSSTADYTSRIRESASGVFTFQCDSIRMSPMTSGETPMFRSASGVCQFGASSDSYVTYLSGSEVRVCNTARSGYKVIKASAFTISSSRRLKMNVNPMTNDEANKIYDLDVVTFDYINGDRNQRGLIAEDAYKIIPSLVQGDVDAADDDYEAIMGIGIDYSKAVPYLIKAMQLMKKELDELKGVQ